MKTRVLVGCSVSRAHKSGLGHCGGEREMTSGLMPTKSVCWWVVGGDRSWFAMSSTPVGIPPCKIRHHRSFP